MIAKKSKEQLGALLWHYLLVRTKIDPWARKYFTSLLATCFLIYADCIHEAIYYLRSYPPFPCQWRNLISLTRIFSWSDWINMTRTNYLSQTPIHSFSKIRVPAPQLQGSQVKRLAKESCLKKAWASVKTCFENIFGLNRFVLSWLASEGTAVAGLWRAHLFLG